jgi:hypothetical protein
MSDYELIKLGFVLIGGFGCLAILFTDEIIEFTNKIKRILK